MPNYSVVVQCGNDKYKIPNFRPLNVCVGEGIIERKRAYKSWSFIAPPLPETDNNTGFHSAVFCCFYSVCKPHTTLMKATINFN